jgi:hypothetical protein
LGGSFIGVWNEGTNGNAVRLGMKLNARAVWTAFGVGFVILIITGNPWLLRIWAVLGLAALVFMGLRNSRVARTQRQIASEHKLREAERSLVHRGRNGSDLGSLVDEELREAVRAIDEADHQSQRITFGSSKVVAVAGLRRRLREFAAEDSDAATLAKAQALRVDAEQLARDLRGHR